MAFGQWQVGLHIQQDKIAIVALQRGKSHWRLCRWWCIPLAAGTVDNGQILSPAALVSALRDWRKELPLQHDISLSFPAERTLQKTLPEPAMVLREPQQVQWVASAMGQALEMTPETLCVDYIEDKPARRWQVTAAQRQDLTPLRTLAAQLRLNVTAIVPDACALQRFLPWLTAPACVLAWSDSEQWLWATEQRWGRCTRRDAPVLSQLAARLSLPEEQLISCSHFDPWQAITRLQPPLPESAEAFAVAIALALGEANE
ncbi:MAG TPA: pilus assembly protein [Enterobacteriaceae bacterium]|nr:pilus assembly protein [Enterobacteriaceae bacterium]